MASPVRVARDVGRRDGRAGGPMILSRLESLRQEESAAREELYTIALELGSKMTFRDDGKKRATLDILCDVVDASCRMYRWHRAVTNEIQRRREIELALMTEDEWD